VFGFALSLLDRGDLAVDALDPERMPDTQSLETI
jgi:hypothetical protein